MIIDPEEHEVTALVARLPAVDACRVVEIGCGEGRLTRRYSARVGHVLAVDNDQAQIDVWRRSGVDANVEVRATSIVDFDLPPASADVVLFAWAL
jgi:16S rRNA A1518/A1519 N6-dimethyltransferase RsmA/KsgA/DIM1 with predicted DNA glycosylase/AP lyase activity